MNANYIVVEDSEGMVREAERILFETCQHSSQGAAIALAGGSTPLALYRHLAALQGAEIASGYPSYPPSAWAALMASHLFWGDERAVRPAHARSNFGAAWRHWLEPVAFPLGQIHRMPAEAEDLAQAAARYESTLSDYFAAHPEKEGRLDLVFLGMGSDGHTASLFPGSPALEETARVLPTVQPETEEPRLSLSLPFLNQARAVVFLVGGAEKAEMVRKAVQPQEYDPLPPAGQLRPSDGSLLWVLDQGAASGLDA